ncbi:MAG: MbnP family protein [Verrucomicrobiota bacterium]
MLVRVIVFASLLPLLLKGSEPVASKLTLEIRHCWNGVPVSVPSSDLELLPSEQIELTRLSYLLSFPRLQSENGEWFGKKDWVAYVDAEAGNNQFVLSGAPRGSFTGLKFFIGLESELDQSDPNQYPPRHPLNPVRNNLHWSWQGTYIYLALEGRLHQELEEKPLGFAYHLGNPSSLMEVTLPLEIDTSRNAVVVLDFHLEKIFLGESPIDIPSHTSTHGREGDDTALALVSNMERALTVREVRYEEPAIAEKKEDTDAGSFIGTPYEFTLPRNFPVPPLPEDVPLTEERVALGKKLFHDPILSKAGTISCATCHRQESALSDPRRFSLGDEGQVGTRQSMPLFNLAWKSSFFWDGRASSLREQVLVPIEDPVEMHNSLGHVVDELAQKEDYRKLFEAAFGDSEVSESRLGLAIEQFLLTLTSFDSRFDRASRGEAALTDEEKRGFELFFTEFDPRRNQFGADCFHCHGGALFTNHGFHNNGLPPFEDLGLEITTGEERDRYKFSTPSLRNIALTAPYMHDGRFDSLEEVVAHYAGGIAETETLDPNLSKHGTRGVPLSEEDQAALVAFLRTLSDPQFIGPVTLTNSGK